MHCSIIKDGKEILVDTDIFEKIKGLTITLNQKKELYVYIMEKGHANPTPLHRFVLDSKGKDGLHVDHINRNPLDNRRENLRLVTVSQNLFNQPALKGKDKGAYTSKYKGVGWHKLRQKWRSYISFLDSYIGLLLHKDEIVCAYSYDVAAKILSKGTAMTNNINKADLTEEQLKACLLLDEEIPKLLQRKTKYKFLS